ncbi:armadillo repeat-containing protein 10 isoform X2 [Corvus moneduloides]|uniref:armadillo repeat-containing protein 10 isoform X2 n=1 Tax=Corvus moneduloides TaxID=1196302 RepID=UPI0013630B41|nr:armadillo repeat-containing protein 10 isoform X2 [Corvus moneduloides]
MLPGQFVVPPAAVGPGGRAPGHAAGGGGPGAAETTVPQSRDAPHCPPGAAMAQDRPSRQRAASPSGKPVSDIIRNLDGVSVIGGMLSNCIPKIKEKALNALNNLSMNMKNQEEIQVFIIQVCRTVESAPLNSDVQLAGLRLLTNMSVTSDYHQKMINSIPCFLHLLLEGTERTQIQVLKVLVNLSANPAMTRHLLRPQVPALVLLFDNCINRDILVRALAFAANLKKNMNDEEGTMIEEYSEASVFFTLCRDSAPFAQRLASLLHHPDAEVKEQVVRILTQ